VFYQPFAKECLTACDWIGTGRGQIDELKETQAALLRVKGGMSTREIEIAKFGGDWRKIFRQLSREKRMAEELELTFTEDAQRDGSTSGQTVMTEDAAA
jgi:capsid protein